MCNEAVVNGLYAETQAELARLLGVTVDELVLNKLYMDENGKEHGRNPNSCLCPIDAEATAKKLGWRFKYRGWDNGDFGEMEFTK